MPRYLVQRNFGNIDDEHLELRARKSKMLTETDFTEITWEHSHVSGAPTARSAPSASTSRPTKRSCALMPTRWAGTRSN